MNNYCKLEDSEYIKYLKNKIENLKQENTSLKNRLNEGDPFILRKYFTDYPEIIDINSHTEIFHSHVNIALFREPLDNNRRHFIGFSKDKEKERLCYEYFINNNEFLDRGLCKQILLEMHKQLIHEVMKDEV